MLGESFPAHYGVPPRAIVPRRPRDFPTNRQNCRGQFHTDSTQKFAIGRQRMALLSALADHRNVPLDLGVGAESSQVRSGTRGTDRLSNEANVDQAVPAQSPLCSMWLQST